MTAIPLLGAAEAAVQLAVGGEDHDGAAAGGGVGHGATGKLGHEGLGGLGGGDAERTGGGLGGGAGDDLAPPGVEAFAGGAGAVELGGEVGEDLLGG